MTGKTTATLTVRKVIKVNNMYRVVKKEDWGANGVHWSIDSKDYAHSTSAFAKLGRLYQNELEATEQDQ